MLDAEKIKAIIFDMDGVVIDSEPIQIAIEKEICRNHNLQVPDEVWGKLKGTKNIDFFTYIVTHFSDGSLNPQQLVDEKVDAYLRRAKEELRLIPGVMEFIHKAQKRFRLSLTTSSGPMTQGIAFDLFDLHPHFEVIITGKDVKNGKPHPEPYLKTVEKLKLTAGACAVIEDSDNGIKSAKAAGCVAIGITTGLPRTQLEEAGADLVVDSFEELSKQLAI